MPNDLERIRKISHDLKALSDTMGAGNQDILGQGSQIQSQIEALAQGVGAIQRAVDKNPDDPVARKALQQVPALTNSLGGVAGGLRRVVLLRQHGASDQDVAAEALRITGSFLEIAATAAVIAPPPYGKIAAEIISAIQSLVNFVAAVLDLAHPAKKEPSVAEIVENAVRSVHGFAQRDLLNGVLAQLNHMHAGLAELHRQKSDPKRHRTFETWPDIWNLVELPAGEGVDVRVDSMPSWLMDEKNLDLEPDPWGEVFYLYLLAKGQYLRNWLSAMLLLNQPDPGDSQNDASTFLVNGDFEVAAVQLGSIVKTEQSILRQLTPFAVRKAMGVMIGSRAELLASPKGFVFEGTEWPFTHGLSGGAITKIAAGPERRVWAVANRDLFFYLLDDQGKQKDFDRYPTRDVGSIVVRDMSVAQSGRRTSEIHALPDLRDGAAPEWPMCYIWDEGKVGNRQPWDHTFYDKMQKGGLRYRWVQPDRNFAQIAAAPTGCLYLLTSDAKLWYWDATPAPATSLRDLSGPSITADAKDVQVSTGTERVYVFGNQDIWYKSHSDIARGANTDWTRIAPPSRAPDRRAMPAGWSYKSVAESEGGAIVANLELPGIGNRFYLWHDDEWEIGASNAYGRMLITLPPDSHETFNALKSKVNELVRHGVPS
ncbi:hypothetical protein [Elioraea sp.]|uniref:hypothetical protein n=1 Tax=Elioraea sp. TaxID=2185103 RepID=UPI003F730C37